MFVLCVETPRSFGCSSPPWHRPPLAVFAFLLDAEGAIINNNIYFKIHLTTSCDVS